jgi:hypothetical protein
MFELYKDIKTEPIDTGIAPKNWQTLPRHEQKLLIRDLTEYNLSHPFSKAKRHKHYMSTIKPIKEHVDLMWNYFWEGHENV